MTIDNRQVAPELDLAYQVRLLAPHPWLFRFAGDEIWGIGTGRKSRLRLFEDNTELGPAHVPHIPLRSGGHGKFLHYFDTLLFSSSDGSDPRTNGRVYAFEDYLTTSLYFNWCTFALITLSLLFNYYNSIISISVRLSGVSVFLFRRSAREIFIPRVSIILIALSTIVAAIVTIDNWNNVRSLNFSYAGWFPLSDAGAWWRCAKQIEHARDLAAFPASDWCQWRHLYPAVLGSISLLADNDTVFMIILQSCILFNCIFWLLREIGRLTSLAGAIFACIVALYYVDAYAVGQLMTENAGLMFGLTGLALLLRGADLDSRWRIALGVAGLSLGMTARPGAMFSLPLLLLWAAYIRRASGKRDWLLAAMVAVSAAAGPLLQDAYILGDGKSLALSGGNFSYTLYGLVSGGRGWTAVMSDHPEITAMPIGKQIDEVYRLSLQEFVRDPSLLLRALSDGWQNWVMSILSFADPFIKGKVLGLFLISGLAELFRTRRDRSSQVIGVMLLGEALSAPWIFSDGGPRVFAATIGVDILLAALGFQFLVDRVKYIANFQKKLGSPPPVVGFDRGPAITMGVLLLLALIPLMRVPALVLAKPLPPPRCQQGLSAHSFYVDEGFVVQKIAAGLAPEWLVAAPVDRLAAEERMGNVWWADLVNNDWPDGTAILFFAWTGQTGVDRNAEHFVWVDAPQLHRGDRLDLCTQDKQSSERSGLYRNIPVVSGTVVRSP